MRPITAFLTGVLATIFVPIVGALIFFKMGWVAVNADAKPGWLEREVAEMSLDASVARHAPKTENPAPQTEETLKAAVVLYKDNCEGCHGGSQGPSDFGLSFYPPAPQFVNRKKPFGATDGELFYVIKHGIRLTGMPSFGSEIGKPMLKDDEIWALVRFLKALQSLPPAVAEEWRGHPSTAPSTAPSGEASPLAAPSGTASPSAAPSGMSSPSAEASAAASSSPAPSGGPASSAAPDDDD